MGLADISLTSAMRSNLFSLQSTSAKMERTQERLASGKKVTTALDNPTSFFVSQAHLNRAADLTARKDGIMEAIKNGDASSIGLKSIMQMIESAKGIASSAHSASASERTSLAKQFNIILDQMDSLAGDSGYRGTNLLKGDDLTVAFNENGSSSLTIQGMDATSSALGIQKATSVEGNVISGGSTHSLALSSDGSVVAWGDNSSGQTTIPLAALSGVVAITAGGFHSLALKSDGSVVAWGDNSSGQTTVPLAAQSGVVAIAAGGEHSLALKDDGSVVAWGDNSSGQTTIPLTAQSGVVAIAAGANYSLALKDDGSVVAWGDNSSGQTTIPLAAQSGVVAITAGGYHSLALKSDGSVAAWGDNIANQTTVPLAALSGVVAVAAGRNHSLALKSDGSVVAWGDNGFGQTTVPVTAQSGVGSPDYSWSTDDGISASERQLETAMNTLRTNSSTMSSTLSVIGVRQQFTDQMVANLETGADNLTLADMNEEGANMLMLQTRQNLGITSLSMAGQSAQAVMKLF